MSWGIPRNRYKFLGDWLIARSESVLGGFQIGVLVNIMRAEGMRDGWLYQITDEDITRILARYKEHVSFWNVGIDVIRSELQTLADALGRSFYDLASRFDALPPKRVPPDLVYTFARVRKDVLEPFPQTPNMGRWVPASFTPDEVIRLQQRLFGGVTAANVQASALTPSICELRGVFARGDLETILHEVQQTETYFQGKTVQYEIIWIS